ncbi:hypothetical protein DIS24_g10107 [Lasiodiplodia hormozganensis]|uniref:Uncharacterized protein n=1 Tax=Lasiodiplodia hormozganensis TaxID=869390 RepID=A0AA39XQ53_9PEZI|nr:hypothetical protein DIS24_g10107 [Lasiodiplodia hormozganensis]
MSSQPNLNLPATAPNTERHRATLNGRYKFAVYSIANLDQARLQALEAKLNSAEYAAGTCKLAPQPSFLGRPLRDVFDYHVRVRDEDTTIHPLYFIVAVYADYKTDGVIVVHLNTGQGEQEDRVDKARCAVDMAASWGMNFGIGNMDWEDLKEEEQDNYGGDQPTTLPSQPSQPAPTTVRWQYSCWSLVPNIRGLDDLLEPGYELKPADQRRVQMAGNYAGRSEPQAEIGRLHPWFCKSHPTAHRQVAIWIDRQDFEGDGVLLVRYDWDGNIDAHDDLQIVRLGLDRHEVKRVPASRAVAELDEYCGEQGLPLATTHLSP